MRLAACLLVAMLGCASAAPGPTTPAAPAPAPATSRPPASPAPSALVELLRTDLSADHAFPWSAARRLAWRDFQGAPPTTAGGPQGAMTAYTLYYAWKCRGGESFDFLAIAGFRPRASWVKNIILNDTAQNRSALIHEQTHFDLAEVHARTMRRRFAALSAPCRKTDAELEAIARRFVQDEKAEQRRYDEETNNGRLDGPQAAWTETVRRRLAILPP